MVRIGRCRIGFLCFESFLNAFVEKNQKIFME